MLLTRPNIMGPSSPAEKQASRSGASVGMKRQNRTECCARPIASTMVSIWVRLVFVSGEKQTRIAALPTVTESDQPFVSSAVWLIGGLPAMAFVLSSYSFARSAEWNR